MLFGLQIQTLCIILILSYLVGNFQTALTLSRRFMNDDVRLHGSGNPGAANMTRVYGGKWGVATFLGDALKCLLGVALGAYLGRWWGIVSQEPALDFALGSYVGGLGVVLGHCWPVFNRFKGGKGVACYFAFMAFSFPLGAIITAAFAVALFLFVRKMSLVSLTSALLFTILSIAAYGDRPYLWLFSLFCTLIIFYRHKDNIRRLIDGTEGAINY